MAWSARTSEAGKMDVQAVVVLHLKLIHHQGPIYGDAVGLAALNGQAVKLDRGIAEAVGRRIVAVDHCRSGGSGSHLLHACEVCLRLAAVVDRIVDVGAANREHTSQTQD